MKRKFIAAKYRAFIKAYIYPSNKNLNAENNDTFVIYIPEHITYETKQEALEPKTRWDYAFGVDSNNVVILIRHITVVDDGYGEVRDMPEFCYDYDTFCKLGGRVEHVTKKENAINIDKIDEDFNELFPNLLVDNSEIHIEAKDIMVWECQEQKNLQIPTPIKYIQDNYIPAGNNNCNRPLVDKSFFEALSAFGPDDVKGKSCHITESYISVNDYRNENTEEMLYDARMKKVVNISEWSKCAYNYTVEEKKMRKRVLEKQGLLDAYTSLKMFFETHNRIKKIDCDIDEKGRILYKIIESDLAYGYKLSGFTVLEDTVIWEITTYERAIKQNDCIRGLDTSYLIFKDGIIVEAAKQIDYLYLLRSEEKSVTADDFELYSDKYVDISALPVTFKN